MYIITGGSSTRRASQEQKERQRYEREQHNAYVNRVQGMNNPVVHEPDYDTPVSKRECLKMIDKLEANAKTPEAKKAAQQMYKETNQISKSDNGIL